MEQTPALQPMLCLIRRPVYPVAWAQELGPLILGREQSFDCNPNTPLPITLQRQACPTPIDGEFSYGPVRSLPSRFGMMWEKIWRNLFLALMVVID